MKKIYTLLIAILWYSFSAQAQRSIDLELLPTKVGLSFNNLQVIAPYDTILHNDSTQYYVRWTIVNHGPDTLGSTDTLYIKSVKGIAFRGALKIVPGDTVELVPSAGAFKFSPPVGAPLPYTDTLSWCDSIWMIKGPMATTISDPLLSNDHNCVLIFASSMKTSGVNTVRNDHADFTVYPNPASGQLNLRFEGHSYTKNVTLLLRNTIGQTVYRQEIGDVSGAVIHPVDISQLPPGIYAAELHYDEEVVVSKLMIQ